MSTERTTPTARRLPPEQRRAQLAQAALAVAAEQGYAGLSLDEVGERAGVTRNLLYHYFPRGRLDVFLAALERAGDELTGDFIVDPGRPLAERLAANTDRAIEHAARASDAWLVWRHARSAAEPEIQAVLERYRDEVVRGMALNHLGTDDPPPLARVGAARLPRLPPDRAGRVARQRAWTARPCSPSWSARSPPRWRRSPPSGPAGRPVVPDEHRLGHERHAEGVLHAPGDLAREGDELRGRPRAAVGQRQRVLARDRDALGVAVPAMKAGALDEPGGRRLDVPVGVGPRRGRGVGRPAARRRGRAAPRRRPRRAPGW